MANDLALIPFTRPRKNQADLEKKVTMTIEDLEQRLQHQQMFLIYLEDHLIGEMGYQVDHPVIYKKEPGTAWIDIMIGEQIARGKRIGYVAFQYLEEAIRKQELHRMQLGVFEFNVNAVKLYRKAGFQEIVRLPDFSFWQDRMWHDIRMEQIYLALNESTTRSGVPGERLGRRNAKLTIPARPPESDY